MQELSADRVPCALIIVDPDERILDVNQLFLDWTGLATADVLGEPLDRFLVDSIENPDRLNDLIGADGIRRPVLSSRTGDTVALMDASERRRFVAELLSGRALEERTRIRFQLIIEASLAF